MSNLFRWFCIVLGVVLMMTATGCKSSKSATTTTYPIHIQQGDSANVLVSNFNQVITDYKDWNDVVVPIKLSLIEPKQLSVGGRVTMEKDKSIYISIRVLGFEAANVYVNNDSIYASYKLDKIYLAEDLRKVLGSFPATISDLQSMLIGRAFVLGKGAIDVSMYREFLLSIDNDYWQIAPNSIGDVDYKFIYKCIDNNISTLEVDVAKENRVNCIYGSSVSTPIGNVPNSATISTQVKNIPLCAKIAWELNNAKWNSGATHKWKTPKGYRRIDVANLLKNTNP